MDTVFLLNEGDRANFFQNIMQSSGCTYICLWTYQPLPDRFVFLDGLFYEENNQASSSSGSLARRFFDDYRQSQIFMAENECVPGLAFKNNHPYLELQELDLQNLASNEAQRQFYKEARIKSAIFMGCKSGEIEIGLSNNASQIDVVKEMRSWFPENFPRQYSPLGELQRPVLDQTQLPSSSSSSLRSLSMDSPEYSSLLFSIPSASHNIPESLRENPQFQQTSTTTTTTTATSTHQQAMQAFAQMRNNQFPAAEIEDAAMTRAILAVLTSSSPSPSSSSHQHLQNLPYSHRVNSKASAFKNYASALAPTAQLRANLQRQSMMKRSIAFFRSLNFARVRERLQPSRPTNTQLHHMISERRRREKLNENFQSLRSLLPPGTKRDKASLLTTTREYLSSLKAQIAELTKKNQLLEAQILPANEEETGNSSNERINVGISQVSESTSEERIIDLRVTVRGECVMVNMVIGILEFLRQVQNVSLISMETSTRILESNSSHHILLRLKIEGSEWDESAFREAVRRVVADLAQ